MPAVIAAWERDVMSRHSAKTQENEIGRGKRIAEAFAEFRAGQVTAPDIAEFLQPLRSMVRTHNLYRSQLRELMRYSIERGWRTENPVDHIRTFTERPRTRYITDSEMRRIKVAGIYGKDGKRTRSGLMLAALFDMSYLTWQDISMLLALRWSRDSEAPDAPFKGEDGLFFRRSKVAATTGAAVTIEWTPRLSEVVDRLRRLRAERLLARRASQRTVTELVLTRQDGLQLSYSGAATAWKRAVKRAGIPGVMFRDIRAKALTDKEARDGMSSARDMAAHSTDSQTAAYVRRKSFRRTTATK